MIVAVFQVYFALNSPRDLVIDNYYKEGLGINQELSKKQMAVDLAIQAKLEVDNLTGEILLVTMNATDDSLSLKLAHAALESKDFHVPLNKIAENQYRGTLTQTLVGNWNAYLESTTGWQMTGRLDMTQSNTLDFNL